MHAYKLMRRRRDGTVGPLFINRRQVVTPGVWLPAENHPTKGYAVRPGWHCCSKPAAPHLKDNPVHEMRQWWLVEIRNYEVLERPQSQGGTWYLSQQMQLIKPLN